MYFNTTKVSSSGRGDEEIHQPKYLTCIYWIFIISCVHNDMHLRIFLLELLEVIILIPCVFLFVVFYDFVNIAWSCQRNVTIILVGVAALLS